MPIVDMTNTVKKIVPASFEKTGSARTLRVKISSGAIDRDNDSVNPRGWRFAQYIANPVVLWSHDKSIPAIARTLTIRVVGDDVIAECEFPPEGIHGLADMIYSLASLGYLHSASVGFLPVKYLFNAQRDGYDIEEQELLEWSFCNVPSNAQALIQRCIGEGCNLPAMKSWLHEGREKRCSCGANDFLEVSGNAGAYLQIDEPGDRLELIDDLVFTGDKRTINRAIGEVFTRELADFITKETADSLQEALDYARGRVR